MLQEGCSGYGLSSGYTHTSKECMDQKKFCSILGVSPAKCNANSTIQSAKFECRSNGAQLYVYYDNSCQYEIFNDGLDYNKCLDSSTGGLSITCGLSTGSVVGVCIGVLLFIGLVGGLIYWCRRRRTNVGQAYIPPASVPPPSSALPPVSEVVNAPPPAYILPKQNVEQVQ